ncbi:polysaccharide deacetylase family protein [Candidatus Bathyarchaeota archaeon]|nr:polysaccharide deacetylase family protein [Candidatus Bathyarchaeota archaeon]
MLNLLISALAATAAASPIASIAPRQAGSVYFGCSVANTVALTFDDGPFTYTSEALDALDAAGFKATFFLNGQNWGNINDYGSVVQRMNSEGHQIGSHTYVPPCPTLPLDPCISPTTSTIHETLTPDTQLVPPLPLDAGCRRRDLGDDAARGHPPRAHREVPDLHAPAVLRLQRRHAADARRARLPGHPRRH